MRYGPIDVKVKKVGPAKIKEDLVGQWFDATLTERDLSFTIRVPVLYQGSEAKIVDRMAAWLALDEMRAAYHDPVGYEAAARESRERTETEVTRIMWGAYAFGDALEEAWGHAVLETQQYMEELELTEGEPHWFPIPDYMLNG